MARSLQVKLSDSEESTINREIARLKAAYGIRITPTQLVSILIEQHRMKLQIASEQEDAADVLAWLWRRDDAEGE